MPDPADIAQMVLERATDYYERHRTPPAAPILGPAECACGEPIPDGRRKAGRHDCIDCARLREARARLLTV